MRSMTCGHSFSKRLLDSFQAVQETDGWVKLAEDEAWARQIIDGFVLMDGAQLGASV